MAGRNKTKTAQHTHEGHCTLCAAIVQVERVGTLSGLAWRCKGAEHLAVEGRTVHVVKP
jgi:hypothetical protein